MRTQAHPLISAALAFIAITVIVGNTLVELKAQAELFPDYKARPTLSETRRHARMIGNWIGESAVESGGRRRVLLQRFADGTFRITFKTRWEENTATLRRQVGQWGIAGPIYFTITTGWADDRYIEPTDLAQPYFYDAYRIVKLEDDYFEFESFSPKRRYVLRRVGEDFSENDL